MSRDLIFRDANGAEYQPVRHLNRKTGKAAFRVKPPGASNETDDCLELDSIEETAKAMLVDNLPARVKPLAGGPDNYLKFGAQKLVSYELNPAIAERIGVPAMSGATQSQADRIRYFITQNYVQAARARGEASIEIISGDVHKAMGLQNALPAVCSVLEGTAFAEKANVKLLGRHSPIGSDKPSSTIRYRFALGEGRVRELNRAMLERLKQAFLSLHPDFTNFADTPSFASNEGDYKQALVAEAQRLLAAMQDQPDAELGAALIELLAGRTELFCNLIDWHAMGVIDKAREAHQSVIEAAAGKLARADDAAEGIAVFVETAWPLLRGDPPINPYAESRMLPTMLRALVDPQSVLAIRSTPTDNATRMLLGRPAFANAPLSPQELATVSAMADEVMRIMDAEWGWAPRDLWDLQGFIWETCQKRLPEIPAQVPEDLTISQEARLAMPHPTNLILYGPPGTGKTYRTMEVAVRYCGETPAQNRQELREQYERLRKDKRIEFVTFHQTFSYEDFVEGLRPPTSSDDGDENGVSNGGLVLDVHPGIFREIVDSALLDRGEDAVTLDPDRSVFKIALGDRGSEEKAILEALEKKTITLGWGGKIDWSAPEYDEFSAILQKWRDEENPAATGKDSNVEQLYALRSWMQDGDYVIVSDGRDRFRAVGQVDGAYEFHAEADRHPHRRKIRLLWRNDNGEDREVFYPKGFRRHSLYRLDPQKIDWASLSRIVNARQYAAAPLGRLPHVLVIDEINRANISKVFGELITLIEPDKRLGMPNALKVRLPYSRREFGVPANLHIVGTMNTADRSIALLDTALRRRFQFEEMAPDTSVPAFRLAEADSGLPLAAVLDTMNRRIEYMVDRDHRIGHAFFIGCETKGQVDAVMRDKVIPLLQEYFFDDWNRLAAVLGEKEKGGNFLACETIEDPLGEGDPMKSWRVRKAFDEGAYHRLVSGKSVAVPATSDDGASAA